MEETKKCTKCGKTLYLDQFAKHKSSSSGIRSECKNCQKQYRLEHQQYIKQWRSDNRESQLERCKQYNRTHRNEIKVFQKRYQTENQIKIQVYKKQYRLKHREELLTENRRYQIDNKDKIQEKKSERFLLGQCSHCKNPRLEYSDKCLFHWVKQSARHYIEGNVDEATRLLVKKLVLQDFRCSYSGISLVPGINCDLDHVYPRSRFPQLVGIVDNLEWVDSRINSAKYNRTREEFMEVLRDSNGILP